MCACVCARAKHREKKKKKKKTFVRLCQCRLLLIKGKEMPKDGAKKKKNLSHSIKLSLYRRAMNADEGRRTTKAAATRA